MMEFFGPNLTGDSTEIQSCFPNLKGLCPRMITLTPIKVAKYVLFAIMILMTLCGNVLVIIAISHFKCLHSPTNLLILSLACTDWFLGAFVMPYGMIRSVENCWYFGETFCKIHSSLDLMLFIASLLHLGLISVDRYLAICKPLQYRTSVTMQKVAAVIGITWFFSFIFGFGGIFYETNSVGEEELFLLAALLGFFMPCALMIVLYMKIFHVAKVQARKIKASLGTRAQNEKKESASEQRERKAAKTLAIVLGVFVLCWLPVSTQLIVDPFVGFSTPAVVLDALIWLSYFNSTCNPLIYGFFYPWFQRVFKIIVSGKVFQKGSSLLNIYTDSF